MQYVNKLQDIDFAKQIFKAWDIDEKGYLSADELTDRLIGLGLSTTKDYVHTLLKVLDNQQELLTLKSFITAFEFDKIGSAACICIRDEFSLKQKSDFVNLKL